MKTEARGGAGGSDAYKRAIRRRISRASLATSEAERIPRQQEGLNLLHGPFIVCGDTAEEFLSQLKGQNMAMSGHRQIKSEPLHPRKLYLCCCVEKHIYAKDHY